MDKFKEILDRKYAELENKEEVNKETSSIDKIELEINLQNYYDKNGKIIESKMDNYSKMRDLLGE